MQSPSTQNRVGRALGRQPEIRFTSRPVVPSRRFPDGPPGG